MAWLQMRMRHALHCRGSWRSGDRCGQRACDVCGVWREPLWLCRWRKRRTTGEGE